MEYLVLDEKVPYVFFCTVDNVHTKFHDKQLAN